MGTWVDHVAATISNQNAKFAAIHMQEVGGKKAATSKPVVKKLVRLLQVKTKHRQVRPGPTVRQRASERWRLCVCVWWW